MQKNATIVLIAIVVVIGGGLFVFGFLDLVVLLGQNIPQDDIASDYVTGVIWALLIGLSIVVWPVAARDRLPLIRCWAAKCMVTLGFMLLYENHYGLDSYDYFSKAADPKGLIEPFIFGAGTTNVAWVAWLHSQIFPYSYHMMKVSFSLVGLLALYTFYRAVVIFLKEEKVPVLYAIALLPSNLFWSSVLGKDPIVLLGIALYVYGVVRWRTNYQVSNILISATGALLAMSFRVWLGPILIAPLAVFTLGKMRGMMTRLMFTVVVGVAFFFTLGRFQKNFNIETNQDLVKSTGVISQSWAIGGGGQVIEGGLNSTSQIIAFMPLGIVTALFRPLPGEILNPFGLLAGFENFFLIFLLYRSFIRTRFKELTGIPLWGVILVLLWATVYGFASYQNLGTAVRFRLQVMPMMLCLLLYFSRKRIIMPSPPPLTGKPAMQSP